MVMMMAAVEGGSCGSSGDGVSGSGGGGVW